MAQPPRNLPHLWIEGGGQAEDYTRPPRKIEPRALPARDRREHANALEVAIGQAIAAAHQQIAQREDNVAEGTPGFYLQMELTPQEKEAIDRLDNRTRHIEVVAVKTPDADDVPIEATVFVPQKAEAHFLEKVQAYRDEDTPNGKPKNEPLVTRIETVRIATVQSLFTDPVELYPRNGQTVWWEVWLRQGSKNRFAKVIEKLNIPNRDHVVSFPERDVVLVMANEATMSRVIRNCDAVAELRLAKDTPALFLNMDGAEAVIWTEDAVDRVVPPDGAQTTVCLLDSGVTQSHPLLRLALDPADMHAIDPAWGPGDTSPQWHGHGTNMSGTILYGDLQPHFEGVGNVTLSHRLESVKILPNAGQNDPELYGYITTEAVARAEIQAPERKRVICMAVTSDQPVLGRPSSWSAAIDQLCFDEDNQRLFVLSAGNIRDGIDPVQYPDLNDVNPMENPAQSWNALTVGAYTDRINIVDPAYAGWEPVSPPGDISPTSRTSVSWQRQWPIKPDVVFEGGNWASDRANDARQIDDLQLLTTHARTNIRLLDTIGDTSAATALCANMAAKIIASRPELRPETVRGLIVHSAEWTPVMEAQIAGKNKTQMQALLRRYGYGVPDLERALLSAANDLTLMVEDSLIPFTKGPSSIKTRDMNVHNLPWPREELIELENTPVSFRVTLSYFIEPNPGERGWTRRHRYSSHSLRFAVKHAAETLDDFRRRINDVARQEEEGAHVGRIDDGNWSIGQMRELGSIHSDWWTGTAIELADRDAIGIFPVGGWWKEKKHLERWDKPARYSLIVTIKAPGAAADIYTPVANQIAVQIPIPG